MYDLAPPQTSFLNDIFGINDPLAEERDRLGFDPDLKAKLISEMNATLVLDPWTPGQHFNILHRGERANKPWHGGAVVVANTIDPVTAKHKTLGKRWFNNNEDRIFSATEAALDEIAFQQKDIYFNQNGFYKWRNGENLIYTTAHYADIDPDHIPVDRRGNKVDYIAEVIAKLVFIGVPLPSYVMSSGRGYNMIWLTDYSNIGKFMRQSRVNQWNKRQRALLDCFDAINVKYDESVKDVTRIFRFSSSINSKSGETVRPLYVQGDYNAPYYYGVSEFMSSCSQALSTPDPVDPVIEAPFGITIPTDYDEVIEIEPALKIPVVDNAVSQDKPKQPRSKNAKSIRSWGYVVRDDLMKLVEHRYGDTIHEGLQDQITFIATAVMIGSLDLRNVSADMQIYNNDQIRETFEMFHKHTDWDETALYSKMQSAISRYQRALVGERNNDGHDPRYKYKASTIVELLNITTEEMLLLDLRALITDDVKLKRDRERKAARRNQQTPAVPKAVRDAERAKRHQLIIDTFVSIGTIKGTASSVSCSKNTVKSVLRSNGFL